MYQARSNKHQMSPLPRLHQQGIDTAEREPDHLKKQDRSYTTKKKEKINPKFILEKDSLVPTLLESLTRWVLPCSNQWLIHSREAHSTFFSHKTLLSVNLILLCSLFFLTMCDHPDGKKNLFIPTIRPGWCQAVTSLRVCHNIRRVIQSHRVIEHLKVEWTHKDHQVQVPAPRRTT